MGPRCGESDPITNVGAWDRSETRVQYPNALADTKCGALIVGNWPDGEVRSTSRA